MPGFVTFSSSAVERDRRLSKPALKFLSPPVGSALATCDIPLRGSSSDPYHGLPCPCAQRLAGAASLALFLPIPPQRSLHRLQQTLGDGHVGVFVRMDRVICPDWLLLGSCSQKVLIDRPPQVKGPGPMRSLVHASSHKIFVASSYSSHIFLLLSAWQNLTSGPFLCSRLGTTQRWAAIIKNLSIKAMRSLVFQEINQSKQQNWWKLLNLKQWINKFFRGFLTPQRWNDQTSNSFIWKDNTINLIKSEFWSDEVISFHVHVHGMSLSIDRDRDRDTGREWTVARKGQKVTGTRWGTKTGTRTRTVWDHHCRWSDIVGSSLGY